MGFKQVSLVSIGCIALLSCAGTRSTENEPGVESSRWETQTAANKPLAGETGTETTVTVAVKKVDVANRLVTVERPDGSIETVHAGPDVRRLAEIKAGDAVRLHYVQALAYEVRPLSESERNQPQTVIVGARNPANLQPGAAVANAVQKIVTITAIDKQAKTVTIKDPGGDSTVVPVERPQNLERVNVGDTALITYIEAVALEVDPLRY